MEIANSKPNKDTAQQKPLQLKFTSTNFGWLDSVESVTYLNWSVCKNAKNNTKWLFLLPYEVESAVHVYHRWF